MLLIECLVYISVFAILLGVGFAAFYALWDSSSVVRSTAGDISRTLQAGEQWRADIRAATGKIEVKSLPDGAWLQIPRGRGKIFYQFSDGTVWRKMASAAAWTPVLSRVQSSEMEPENRHQIRAWRWDVELRPRYAKAKTRPLFTFEAVAPIKP